MKQILLIEDDMWLGELYKNALKRLSGTKVIHVDSAELALGVLDKDKVDLMILDIFLKQHNGVELVHEVASYSDTQKTPIIVLSSVLEHDFGMTKERWREYGVVKYLYKPNTKPNDLIAEVSKTLLINPIQR